MSEAAGRRAAGARVDQRPQLAERWAIWRAEKASRRRDDRGHGVASANVFDSLSRLTPAGMTIAVNVGNNTYSFGRYFECKPGQRVLMSGYLGSIGFATRRRSAHGRRRVASRCWR